MRKTIILFLTIFSIISCSKDDNDLIKSKLFGNSNFDSSTVLPTSQVLSFNPSSINFGTVQNNTNNTRTITITNSFDYPVNISVTHTNSVTSIVLNIANFQIEAGGTYEYSIIFSPTSTMFLNDTINFSYPGNLPNSIGSITQNVDLTGNSVATLPTSLSVAPSGTLDFGNVIVGQTSTRNITLNNIGGAIASWTPVGTIFTVNPSFGTLNAGASQTITLAFTATGVGVFTGTFTISFNGGTVQIPYTVNRIAATRIISVSATSTAFGNVQIGTTANKTFKITNSGNSNLTVTSIVVNQVNPRFATSYSGVIAPGQFINVNISFTPTNTNTQTCTIIAQADQTNGTGTGITSLQFSGKGI